jgi:hypothetical protein
MLALVPNVMHVSSFQPAQLPVASTGADAKDMRGAGHHGCIIGVPPHLVSQCLKQLHQLKHSDRHKVAGTELQAGNVHHKQLQ